MLNWLLPAAIVAACIARVVFVDWEDKRRLEEFMRKEPELTKPVKAGNLRKPAPTSTSAPAPKGDDGPSHYAENQGIALPPGPRTFEK